MPSPPHFPKVPFSTFPILLSPKLLFRFLQTKHENLTSINGDTFSHNIRHREFIPNCRHTLSSLSIHIRITQTTGTRQVHCQSTKMYTKLQAHVEFTLNPQGVHTKLQAHVEFTVNPHWDYTNYKHTSSSLSIHI